MKGLKDFGKGLKAGLSRSDWRKEGREWLNELELLSTSRALEELTAKYQELTVRYSAAERLERLEFCRANLSRRLEEIQADYVRRTAAELARDTGTLSALDGLLNQAAAAYAGLLEERGVTDEIRLVALYRTAVYHAARIFLSYMSYREPPPGHWLSLHRIFRDAEQAGLSRQIIPEVHRESFGLADPSVENIYKRILIVDAGNPFRMLRAEASQAFSFLSNAVNKASIEPVSRENLTKGGYYVVLTDDEGPRRWDGMTEIRVADTRLLAPGGLVKHMRTAAGVFTQQLKEAPGEPWDLRLRRDMALRLARIWDPLPHRRHARLGAEGDIELALGSGSVHHYLSGGAEFSPAPLERRLRTLCDDEGDFVPTDVWDTGSVAATSSGSDRDAGGGWNWAAIELDQAGAETTAAVNADAVQNRATFETHRHRLENASHGGFEFTWNHEVSLQTQVGDLAAYRLVNGGEWRLGTIRWLQIGEDQTRLGTMHITDEILPIALKTVKNRNEAYHRALLSGGSDPEAEGVRLLLGTGTATSGEVVWLLDPKFLVRAKLTTQRTATPSFSTFEYEIESICRPAL